ncbi:uncharacterized protein LOC129315194 [Prosopis cineraria]|uniref:uncharacterized protein LOC129315194 n=1 Tax=Prosopis cineraria TaxID=364024 RepID=UPI00240F7304|nr:uncharacterized protein LOC129315194 [Prosopis cineraria]
MFYERKTYYSVQSLFLNLSQLLLFNLSSFLLSLSSCSSLSLSHSRSLPQLSIFPNYSYLSVVSEPGAPQPPLLYLQLRFMVKTRSRHQQSRPEMEDFMVKIEENNGKIDALTELVDGLSQQFQSLVRDREAEREGHHRNGQIAERHHEHEDYKRREGYERREYRRPMQFTKMEFPKFTREDVLGWILKCERYFELDETPEETKIKMASMHLDPRAFQWHQAYEKSCEGIWPTWEEYIEEVKDRFGPVHETPMSDLARLKRRGVLAEYHDEFDMLACKLRLPEEYLVDMYLSGLREEYEGPVHLFKPRTLREARKLVRMQEIIFQRQTEKKSQNKRGGYVATSISATQPSAPATQTFQSNTWGSYKKALMGNGAHTKAKTPSLPQKSVSVNQKLVNTVPKILSADEEAEHRRKNLCFYCHENFSRDHRCPQRQRLQLHFIEVNDVPEEVTQSEEEGEVEGEDTQPFISLHAMEGVDDGSSMRLIGYFGKRKLHILIDSGSTHDFLDFNVAKRLGWQADGTKEEWVEVAGGRRLKVHGIWEGFKWRMQGLEFSFDFRILELHTYDLILGLKWLKSIKNAFWDYESLTMFFWLEGKMCKLQAMPSNTLRVVQPKRVEIKDFSTNQVFLLQLIPKGREKVEIFSVQTCTEIPEAINSTLQGFPNLFEAPKGLPPFHEGHDHSIVLQEGTNPVNLKPYRYPSAQKDVIEGLVKELLHTGVIQESSSPFSAPIVLVKKKDGIWRMCIDYRELNKKTVKNQYPIPLVEDLFDELSVAKWFTKLDLRAGYHQIRMVPQDVSKTAFKTHSGHYEWLVTPFGLTNAPATFQGAMNSIFRPYLRKFVLVFFDDILIYSSNLNDHVQHLKEVFSILRQHQFFIKKSKCSFAASEVEYLGHLIGGGQVRTDPKKVQAVAEWPEPTNIKQLRAFLGLAGYYRRFVKSYGILAKPLTLLLKKNGFEWSRVAAAAFTKLKEVLISAPVLTLPDFSKQFVVETDACGVGVGAVLMQSGQPIAYFSKGLAERHQKLSIYEEELMAVVLAVLHWHQYLERKRFIIRSDQQSLKYLLGQKLKISFQMFWVAKLAGFDYEIQYKKGNENSVADALSRILKQ